MVYSSIRTWNACSKSYSTKTIDIQEQIGAFERIRDGVLSLGQVQANKRRKQHHKGQHQRNKDFLGSTRHSRDVSSLELRKLPSVPALILPFHEPPCSRHSCLWGVGSQSKLWEDPRISLGCDAAIDSDESSWLLQYQDQSLNRKTVSNMHCFSR